MNISSEWVTALFTLLGTVFAGVGLKITEWWLNRASDKSKVDKELRTEYRETITDKRQDIMELKKDLESAKNQIDALESEVDQWRERYYAEVTSKMELVARLRILEERYSNE